MKNILFSCFVFFFLALGLCCKQERLSHEILLNNSSFFLGDSSLKKKNYFRAIASEEGYSILEKQNRTYSKQFSSFNEGVLKSIKIDNISLKLIKENINNSTKIKINLYVYKNNERIDSLDFYRNISNDGFGQYNCMSYFDEKSNKIWQIKYFLLSNNKSVDIISYTESSITPNGNIKLDSLYYLDESLDAEMEKYSLYY